MSRPAARVADMHFCPIGIPIDHVGGPILPRNQPQTLINGKPAARVSDKADCTVPSDDTVRGGLMTVFIDGMPASRIHDNTDIGLIMEGSPDVMLGESPGGPLTPFQAQWLYNYLDRQRDTIPFEYVNNGCHARADRMCELISSLGIPVQKQWVRATRASGQLRVEIPNYPDGVVKWDWHVAPVVEVAQPAGAERRVLDPSLGFGRPVTVAEWMGRQTKNSGATVTGATAKDVYRRAWNKKTETWEESYNTPRHALNTRDDLSFYRDRRAELPNESGRRVPNSGVHY